MFFKWFHGWVPFHGSPFPGQWKRDVHRGWETGNGRQEAEIRRQETGDGRRETRDRLSIYLPICPSVYPYYVYRSIYRHIYPYVLSKTNRYRLEVRFGDSIWIWWADIGLKLAAPNKQQLTTSTHTHKETWQVLLRPKRLLRVKQNKRMDVMLYYIIWYYIII